MQEQFLQINGLRICVASLGSGPAIVISHGWLDHAGSWMQVAQQLASAGFRVIVPDQRGHGRSEHVPQSSHYHFPDYVADLALLLNVMQLKEYSLIGHSMGGTVEQ